MKESRLDQIDGEADIHPLNQAYKTGKAIANKAEMRVPQIEENVKHASEPYKRTRKNWGSKAQVECESKPSLSSPEVKFLPLLQSALIDLPPLGILLPTHHSAFQKECRTVRPNKGWRRLRSSWMSSGWSVSFLVLFTLKVPNVLCWNPYI